VSPYVGHLDVEKNDITVAAEEGDGGYSIGKESCAFITILYSNAI